MLAFALLAATGYGVYRVRVRPRMTAGKHDAARARLRHSSTDRFGLRELPFSMLARLTPPWKIGNILWGRWEGREVTLFDVWSGGRHLGPSEGSAAGHAYRCVVTSFPAAWPSLVVEPERLASQLADAVSTADIEFESGAFNRRFDVRCDDRRFATAFLDARLIAWLLSLEDVWGFEIGSGLVLAYGELHDVQESTSALSTVRALPRTRSRGRVLALPGRRPSGGRAAPGTVSSAGSRRSLLPYDAQDTGTAESLSNSFVTSDPSARITYRESPVKICSPERLASCTVAGASRSLANATHSPSGDQTGKRVDPPPVREPPHARSVRVHHVDVQLVVPVAHEEDDPLAVR